MVIEARPRRTKLICTIGPASRGVVPALIEAGMDVARLNFSHGTPASRRSAAAAVRAGSAAAERPVALLADLAGPKIRLGEVRGGTLDLEAGRRFVLHGRGGPLVGERDAARVGHPSLGRDLRPGDRILLGDGAVELRVLTTDPDAVATEVVVGGTVRSRAGVNVPSERLRGPSLTRKDRADLALVAELGVEYVAQSFVRSAADVRELRELLGPDGPPIVAKIETRGAIDAFDDILAVADAVMIARGDMGVELPYEEVPVIQKELVRRALDRGRPSIVATEMLQSMMTSPRPTRAEASDVANAVFDGADAIMLSGETAIGAHPVLAARSAARIARLCEERGARHLPAGMPAPTEGDAGALAYAAVALARAQGQVGGIACYTRTGATARLLSALRPPVPVYAFSPDPRVVTALALVHGVVPRTCVPPSDAASRLGLMAWLLREADAIPAGSAVVLVASTAAPGTGPNLLEVHRLPA